jgi:hypothetical protein
MKTTSRTSFCTALLLAVTLAGCSASTSSSNALIPAAGSQTRTGTPTPTAIHGDTNQDGKLSEFEKQKAAQNAVRDYTLTDGTVVGVDPNAPLPAEVVASIKERMLPIGGDMRAASTDHTVVVLETIRENVEIIADELDRGIIFTFQLRSAEPTGEAVLWAGVFSGVQISPVQALKDGEKFNAEIADWAAMRDYEVIHIQ